MNRKSAIGLGLGILGVLGAFAGLYVVENQMVRNVLLIAFVLSVLLILFGLLQALQEKVDLSGSWSNLRVCKQLGIRRIYRRGVKPGPWSQLAGSADIRIMAVSANGLLKQLESAIVAALRENRAFIRILLAEPNSQFVREIEEVESVHRSGKVSPEIEGVVSLLVEYVEEAARGKRIEEIGKVVVGYYSTHLRSSLTLCDDNWGWLTLNLPPKRAVESVSFELVDVDGGLLDACIKHFDESWRILERRGKLLQVGPKPYEAKADLLGTHEPAP